MAGNVIPGASTGNTGKGIFAGGVTPVTFMNVNAGNTSIGAAGDLVGDRGIYLDNAQGSLTFGALDIYSGGNRTPIPDPGALFADGSMGTGLALGSGMGSQIVASSAPAVKLTSVASSLSFDSITATNPGASNDGIELNTVTGTFGVTGTTNIATAASTAASTGISISSGSVASSFTGAVNIGTLGTVAGGVWTTSSGTTSFVILNIKDTGGAGFAASSSGQQTVSNATSAINTTNGTALNLATTNVGTFTFASITQSGTAAGNGINISASIGTKNFSPVNIANTTGIGISLSNAGTVNIDDGSPTSSINSTFQAFIAFNTPLGVSFMSTSSSSGTNNVVLSGNSGSANFGVGALSGSSAAAFSISGGSVTSTYGGSITNASADSINISNPTGGGATFSGNIADTGSGS